MLRVYGVEGCGPCEVTKLFLRSRHVLFEFIDVETETDKRRELEEKLGSLTSGVILEDSSEDGDDIVVMQGVSVAKLSDYLKKYRTRHPV